MRDFPAIGRGTREPSIPVGAVGAVGAIAGPLLRLGLLVALLAGLSGTGTEAQASADSELLPPALEASDALFGDDFDDELDRGVRDPIEGVNRGVFAGNRAVERTLFDPIVRFYGWAVPDPARRAVRGVFDTLNQPVVIVNDLLQGEFRLAGQATGRLVLNATFGLGGIFDPALEAGWESHHADFGQTLGRYGVGPGFYLMLPLLGPSTARDAVGSLVDLALRPDTWLLPVGPRLLLGGTWGLSERDAYAERIEALERSSIDFYASVRSAYWMHRESLVTQPRGGHDASLWATHPPESEPEPEPALDPDREAAASTPSPAEASP